jgi:hypothetical protein
VLAKNVDKKKRCNDDKGDGRDEDKEKVESNRGRGKDMELQ